jgi:hypothetical protein
MVSVGTAAIFERAEDLFAADVVVERTREEYFGNKTYCRFHELAFSYNFDVAIHVSTP